MAKKKRTFWKRTLKLYIKNWRENLGHQQKFYWRSEKDEKITIFP